MEAFKTSKKVEFDVIYADGTRRHVTEGILFEVENERIVFHNGTDRPEVVVASAEAVAEVIGNMNFPMAVLAMILENISKNILLHARLDG